MSEYHPFAEARPIAQYAGQAGHELGGQALTPAAYQALAQSRSSGIPCELVATGQWVYDDGRRFLELRVTREYIEATSDMRHHDGRLRWLCPRCGLFDGRHTKACDL